MPGRFSTGPHRAARVIAAVKRGEIASCAIAFGVGGCWMAVGDESRAAFWLCLLHHSMLPDEGDSPCGSRSLAGRGSP